MSIPTLHLGDFVVVGDSCFRVVMDVELSRFGQMFPAFVREGHALDAEALEKNYREREAILKNRALREQSDGGQMVLMNAS